MVSFKFGVAVSLKAVQSPCLPPRDVGDIEQPTQCKSGRQCL